MIRVGLQRLLEKVSALRGARVALLAHPASVAVIDGKPHHAVDLVHNHNNLKLVRLFGPEHGLYGKAQEGEQVADGLDAKTGLEVISLYGERRAPEPDHLQTIAALLFDLQDVGVRCFTYLSTLKACLQVCAETDTQLVVLDRPNPLGRSVFGPGVEAGFESFVAAHDVPFVHGKTLGELALVLAKDLALKPYLEVIAVEGWEGEPWDQTELPWLAPSPNLPRFESALCYPATVFLEGTNLSEGRGTDFPFEQFGAPWLQAERLADELNGLELGVSFSPTRFIPSRSKYAGQSVQGVRLKIDDRDRYNPLTIAEKVLALIYQQNAGLEWLTTRDSRYFVDLLYGSDWLRHSVTGKVENAEAD